MEAPDETHEQRLLQQARLDGQALVEITRSRELGVPTFVIGSL